MVYIKSIFNCILCGVSFLGFYLGLLCILVDFDNIGYCGDYFVSSIVFLIINWYCFYCELLVVDVMVIYNNLFWIINE